MTPVVRAGRSKVTDEKGLNGRDREDWSSGRGRRITDPLPTSPNYFCIAAKTIRGFATAKTAAPRPLVGLEQARARCRLEMLGEERDLRVQQLLPFRNNLRHQHEAMEHAVVALGFHRDAGGGECLAVGFAFIPQRIKLGG